MNYPNRAIKIGERDKTIVRAIQRKLNEINCGLLVVDGDFGTKTNQAVKLFQATHKDQNNNPLEIDGTVGALTWHAMFGQESVPVVLGATNQLLIKTLEFAIQEIGVKEDPPCSNRGQRVQEYQAAVGIAPGNPWCCAYVYWCFKKASEALARANPVTRTGSCMYHWSKTTGKKILALDAVNKPSLVKPGNIFIINTGGFHGHTGFVEKVEGGFIHTIEGNSNTQGSREGIGVFRNQRKLSKINRGFISYS